LISALIPRPSVVAVVCLSKMGSKHKFSKYSFTSAVLSGEQKKLYNDKRQLLSITHSLQALLQENNDNYDLIPFSIRDIANYDFRSLILNENLPTSVNDPKDTDITKFADMVLISTLCCILGDWKAQLAEWNQYDIEKTYYEFCSKFSDAESSKFLEWINRSICCDFMTAKRVLQADRFKESLNILKKYNLYENPVRYLLVEWMQYSKSVISE
jgi:hypothetical protein